MYVFSLNVSSFHSAHPLHRQTNTQLRYTHPGQAHHLSLSHTHKNNRNYTVTFLMNTLNTHRQRCQIWHEHPVPNDYNSCDGRRIAFSLESRRFFTQPSKAVISSACFPRTTCWSRQQSPKSESLTHPWLQASSHPHSNLSKQDLRQKLINWSQLSSTFWLSYMFSEWTNRKNPFPPDSHWASWQSRWCWWVK